MTFKSTVIKTAFALAETLPAIASADAPTSVIPDAKTARQNHCGFTNEAAFQTYLKEYKTNMSRNLKDQDSEALAKILDPEFPRFGYVHIFDSQAQFDVWIKKARASVYYSDDVYKPEKPFSLCQTLALTANRKTPVIAYSVGDPERMIQLFKPEP